MKTIEEVRLQNARTLLARYKTLSEFANVLDRSATQISRVMGKNPSKTIGSKLARHIESCTSMQTGWLDLDHSRTVNAAYPKENHPLTTIPIREVPIISWVQAGSFCSSETQVLPADSEMIFCPTVGASERTFALRVVGDSMTSPYGRSYPEGTIIFVDPLKEATIGKRVVARTIKGHTFKQLAENEFGERYLKPLNPSHQPILEDGIEICGVVIGSYNPE
ncbi:hypothetical protein A9259_08000 [Vibrio cyclitrophicus]|uniref:LexA family protein n=1 Tax=Vibrio cyclitrophicus TaxID=47951 RepID=UPI0007EEEBDF|nr:S24 family peptidase [Vibrio cyclitrophicus]OBS98391.1 hypothetical protein A9259_08000 [Vibrio cyclitrophicus]